MYKTLIHLIIASLFLASCLVEDQSEVQVTGLKPVYINSDSLQILRIDTKTYENLGKFITVGNFIYINERYEGIHVIDNTNPSDPKNVHFWQITGCIDFTIKDQFLYAENGYDLLTVDITNPADIKLKNRIKNIYQRNGSILFPENYEGFFECTDPSLGLVIKWEEALLINPKCRI